MRPGSRRPRAASTGPGRPANWSARCAPSIPGPGLVQPRDLRIKVLAARVVDGDGAPGAVLDGRMTIACGARGALRPLRLQRAGRKPQAAKEFCAAAPSHPARCCPRAPPLPHMSTTPTLPHRRGGIAIPKSVDTVSGRSTDICAHARRSVPGYKRTFRGLPKITFFASGRMSAFGGKADLNYVPKKVRLWLRVLKNSVEIIAEA